MLFLDLWYILPSRPQLSDSIHPRIQDRCVCIETGLARLKGGSYKIN